MSTSKRIDELSEGVHFKLNGAEFVRGDEATTEGRGYFWADVEGPDGYSHIFYGAQEVDVEEPEPNRFRKGKLYLVRSLDSSPPARWFCYDREYSISGGLAMISEAGVIMSTKEFAGFISRSDREAVEV